MARMGHDSERAAMIYLHNSDERQHKITDTLSQLARDELRKGQAPGRKGCREPIGHATASKPREDHPDKSGNRA